LWKNEFIITIIFNEQSIVILGGKFCTMTTYFLFLKCRFEKKNLLKIEKITEFSKPQNWKLKHLGEHFSKYVSIYKLHVVLPWQTQLIQQLLCLRFQSIGCLINFFYFYFKSSIGYCACNVMVCVVEVDILVLHKYVIVLTVELNMVMT